MGIVGLCRLSITFDFISFIPRFISDSPFSRQSVTNFSRTRMHHTAAKRSANTYFKYIPIEDVEELEKYRPGGYHPTSIGDYLHNRYRIVHKLGYGAYSTIWLAKDEDIGRYVAVKLSTADSSRQESDILHQLAATGQEHRHPGRATIPSTLDEFLIKGPNGEHRCLVTTPASMSLSDAKDSSYTRLFQLPVARSIIAQLIQGVAFLHSRGVVHAGMSSNYAATWVDINMGRGRYPSRQHSRTTPSKYRQPLARSVLRKIRLTALRAH